MIKVNKYIHIDNIENKLLNDFIFNWIVPEQECSRNQIAIISIFDLEKIYFYNNKITLQEYHQTVAYFKKMLEAVEHNEKCEVVIDW